MLKIDIKFYNSGVFLSIAAQQTRGLFADISNYNSRRHPLSTLKSYIRCRHCCGTRWYCFLMSTSSGCFFSARHKHCFLDSWRRMFLVYPLGWRRDAVEVRRIWDGTKRSIAWCRTSLNTVQIVSGFKYVDIKLYQSIVFKKLAT